MQITGLDVQGLDMFQISARMEIFLTEHFKDYTVASDENGIFVEVYRLAYGEISHLLLQPEGKQLFNGNEWLNGASGCVELNRIDSNEKEAYTAMLVLDEAQENALFLYVSKWDATTQNEVNILIKNFTQGGE